MMNEIVGKDAVSDRPLVEALLRDGVTVLPAVFSSQELSEMRDIVLSNMALLKNTRPTKSSRHLAGFHQYPVLEGLHAKLTGSRPIRAFLESVFGHQSFRTIGLSDITINRSQPWHTDLLRGKYATFVENRVEWAAESVGIYKALVYLQDSSSLQVAKGSHRQSRSLENDDHAAPSESSEVARIPVKAGDVVILDIRSAHRGADEADYISGARDADPAILVSTVFADTGGALTEALEMGNVHRLSDWRTRHA